MKLIDHLKARNLTVAEFAASIGEADNTVRKIVYGQRQPSLPLAIKISEATEGEVTPGELVMAGEGRSAVHDADHTAHDRTASAGPDDEISPVSGSAAA